MVGNFDGQGDAPDTRNDDAMSVLCGCFTSGVGGLRGDFQSTPGPLNYTPSALPFVAGGAQDGTAGDYDSDGDIDIGQPGSDVTTQWVASSLPNHASAVRFDGTTNGWFNGDVFAATTGLDPEDFLINATSQQMHLADLVFTVTGGSGSALVNFILRGGNAATAVWYEDGALTQKTPDNALFAIGAPVIITQGVPEPSAVGLAGLAALGLLARRRARHLEG
jgi:hypothetical protein